MQRRGEVTKLVKAICELESLSPYSQSRNFEREIETLARETKDDREHRCWKNRMHVTEDGNVFIPPMAFKNGLSETAKYISMQIPGKGKSTYTKHFEAGVMVVVPVDIGIKAETVKGEWLYVPADGRRGGPKRVWRCFPYIPKWKGTVEFIILDDAVTEEVFTKHLAEFGSFIGVGRFRPRNNGYYGRFRVNGVEWAQ